MSIHHLIFQNLKKNLKNYYLYVFALVFSAALYFAFVTMQYDPALDEMKSSIKGAAAIRAASVLLVAIVSVFLLYANTIFIKRRGREIGLFRLIGMTKMHIFRILSTEKFHFVFRIDLDRYFCRLFSLEIMYDDAVSYSRCESLCLTVFFKQGARSDVNCVRGDLRADYDDELLIY